VYFLREICPDAQITYHKPRESLLELTAGRVDAAIVPVVDYFTTPGLEMVEGLGICADGKVESVLLQCECSLDEVRTVSCDPASKTSNILAELLLKRHFHIAHDIKISHSGDADAYVVIGDRALCTEPAFASYDLAAEWKNMTGLPFVFAVWVHRAGFSQKFKLYKIVQKAKVTGLEAIERLAKVHAARLGLPNTFCYHYLTSCLHYDIGPQETAAMQLFRELAGDLIHRNREPLEPGSQIRRIIRDEHKSRGIEPVLNPL
jgi:chorismate dehydratase